MLLMSPSLHRLSKEQLLDIRFCDLGLGIEGTWLEEPIDIVRRELEVRGIGFQPHYWLADEWFSPDGVPGVAIPFYLAHTRLTRLESTMMFEVEGSKRSECLRLLRHEVGHALDTAYGLHRRRNWQRIFGKNSQPYPDYYRPRP